jgi:hypothetical protein
MESNGTSLKKRAIIVCVFVGFLLLLFFIALFAKRGTTVITGGSVSPTLVPLNANNGGSRIIPSLKINTAPGAPNGNLGVVTFKISQKNIPSSGVVYTQTPSRIPSDIVSHLQGRLLPGAEEKIVNTPKGQVIFMREKDRTLTIYLYSRVIVYNNETPEEGSTLSQDQLLKRAVDFMRSLSLANDRVPPSVSYYSNKTGDLVDVNSLAASDIVDIAFPEQVNGLLVFHQYGSDSRAHVWMSRSGEVLKLTYHYTPVYEPKTSISIPTIDQAEELIRKDKGIVVNVGGEYQQGELESPSGTVFTSVSVGYFNDGESEVLAPIFVFKGTSTIEGHSYPITVYLPLTN